MSIGVLSSRRGSDLCVCRTYDVSAASKMSIDSVIFNISRADRHVWAVETNNILLYTSSYPGAGRVPIEA